MMHVRITTVLAFLLASSAALHAAPIVVTPGGVAGYVYFPASVSASGSGGGVSLSAATCNSATQFANIATFSTPGGPFAWTVPDDVGCVRIEIAGAGGGGGGSGSNNNGGESWGGKGGNGGNGGDSYVLNASNQLVGIGCGGGGGGGGLYARAEYGNYGIQYEHYVYGHVPNQATGGSGHVHAVYEGHPHAYCYSSGGVATTSSTDPTGPKLSGGLYDGAIGKSSLSVCPVANSSSGGEGGSGYRKYYDLPIAPGTQLKIHVGNGGGGGVGGPASNTTGAHGTSYSWYSAQQYECKADDRGAWGGGGGARVYNKLGVDAGHYPGLPGSSGGNGWVKIYY